MKNILDDLKNIRNKNILFLQGPMGFYFKKLQVKLKKTNNVFRIGFNKGDEFFSLKEGFYSYKGNINKWEEFISIFLEEKHIDIVFLFGDTRTYHSKAINICKSNKILVYVFEEGYIRPNYITLEKYGTNNYSILPRERLFYEKLDFKNIKIGKEKKISQYTYLWMAWQAGIYYLISSLFKNQYPNYLHHRNFSTRKEFLVALINFYRWVKYKIKEKNLKNKYKIELSKKYFFVVLQTVNDSQIKFHSNFNSMEEFIVFTIKSFSSNAPKDKILVFKHHPMDRGRADYFSFILNLSIKFGISKRVHIIYDVHLPTLLKNAIGTITINSTVGLSSLNHKTPVICLGKAIYDIDGITARGLSLDEFWNLNLKINTSLLENYKCYLIKYTQINGSFYK